MTTQASFRTSFLPLSHCSSCSSLRSHSSILSYINHGRRRITPPRLVVSGSRVVKCSVRGPEIGPGGDSDDKDKGKVSQLDTLNKLLNNNVVEAKAEVTTEGDNVDVTGGSPLPGVKPQQLDELIMIPKETIDLLKGQVFGFDTFFVTSQEPYEGGLLFKGNLHGSAAVSYEKIDKRLHETFRDQYKLFLLINPEDDNPVAVVVPRKTLQPETNGTNN